MQPSATIVYDSGRFPVWLRIPALFFGLFMFYGVISIFANSFLGLDMDLGMSRTAYSSTHTIADFAWLFSRDICASCIPALIGLAWIVVWIAHFRIMFDPVGRDLIIATPGCFHWRERRLPVADCREFHLHFVGGDLGYAGSRQWQLRAMFPDGRMQRLVIIPGIPGTGEAGIQLLQTSLQAASGLPVIKHEGRFLKRGDDLVPT